MCQHSPTYKVARIRLGAFVSRTGIALGLLLANAASGQSPYVVSTSSAPYTPITAPNVVALTAPGTLEPERYGRATIPIGFTFPFYDKLYDAITVTAHGMAAFHLHPTCTSCTYGANTTFPNGWWPNGIIAPFWDDLRGGNSFSKLAYANASGPQGNYLTVEWSDWNGYSAASTYSLTFQVRLYETGVIEMHYGPLTGTGFPITAGVGIEDPTGTKAVVGKSCTRVPADGGTVDCAFSDFTPNEVIRFGPPAGADLSVVSLRVDSISESAGALNVATSLRLRNFGQAVASNFTYRLFLSGDTQVDANDTPLVPASQGPISMASLESRTFTANSTVPKPSAGAWYLIAQVDDAHVVAEYDEGNNVGATSTPLISGVDLVAQDVSGPVGSGPGEPVSVRVQLTNQGLDAAGTVDYKIWLSADTSLSPNDFAIHSGAFTLTGGQTVSQPVAFNFPTNVPSGDYHLVLQLDEANAIAEVSESNNVVVGPQKITSRQADLVVDPVRVRDDAPPHGPAEVAFFGENVRLEVMVSNVGGATAANFGVSFYLSDNATLNAISDPFVGEVNNLSLPPGASTMVTLTAPVPAKANNGLDLQAGDYYFFASATGSSFIDVVSANNLNKSALQRLRGPAPDLVATALVGPSKVGAGESMTVMRTLRNVGNRAAGTAAYRYYLSANPIITEDDVLLPIVTGSGTVDERLVTLGLGQEDVATETVRVPLAAPSATYYLGVLVDPPKGTRDGAVLEISESNNGLASQLVDVVPPSLRIVNGALPDAVVGMGYDYQLVAAGAPPPYAFALAPGAGTPPDGIRLTADGRLTGAPTEARTVGFTVVVSAGSKSAEQRLVMRSVPFTAELTITSTRLPPLVRLQSYEAFLSAQGGQAPYHWSVVSGQLPQGVTLSEAGRLAGLPTGQLGATYDFTLRARDAAGNTDAKTYRLEVVTASALTIQTPELPPALVGSEYVVDVVAANADGAPLEKPLEWTIGSGTLPAGLTLSPADDVVLIRGNPTEPGNFALSLEVEDAKGRSDQADFVLVVHPTVVVLRGGPPPVVAPGEAVDAVITADAPARFRLHNGSLPPGLSLSDEGRIAGTVPADAPLAPHTFVVLARTEAGAQGLASFTIEVAEPGAHVYRRSCGCASTHGAAGWVLLMMAWLVRRRRPARLARTFDVTRR